jgi:aspartokinase
MKKISDSVFDIISGDEIALEAIRMGILNLSAYAKRIQRQISQNTYKSVSVSAIVTSLSRMRNKLLSVAPLRPTVIVKDLSIKSPLIEISYEKTNENVYLASKLVASSFHAAGFFTITQGIGEISLIVSQELKNAILKHFHTKPKGLYDRLVAVTLRFNEKEYIEVPNMIYALVATLAAKRINIIEVVSTFTEISFIVREKDMKETVDAFHGFFPQLPSE